MSAARGTRNLVAVLTCVREGEELRDEAHAIIESLDAVEARDLARSALSALLTCLTISRYFGGSGIDEVIEGLLRAAEQAEEEGI